MRTSGEVRAPTAEGVGAVPAPMIVIVGKVPAPMVKATRDVHAAAERVRVEMVRVLDDLFVRSRSGEMDTGLKLHTAAEIYVARCPQPPRLL